MPNVGTAARGAGLEMPNVGTAARGSGLEVPNVGTAARGSRLDAGAGRCDRRARIASRPHGSALMHHAGGALHQEDFERRPLVGACSKGFSAHADHAAAHSTFK